jgi:hypothetical protein
MAAASTLLEAGPRRRCDARLNASSESQDCENAPCYVHVYNLFRPTNHPALLCAVRSDHVVPTFVNARDWEFVDALSNLSRAPLGFTAEEADEGMRYNGFYLFLNYAALPNKGEEHRVSAYAPSAPGPRESIHRTLPWMTNSGSPSDFSLSRVARAKSEFVGCISRRRPRTAFARLGTLDYRQGQRRAVAKRTLIVVAIAASFFGLVGIAGRTDQFTSAFSARGAVTTTVSPADLDTMSTGSITKSVAPRPRHEITRGP